MRLRIGDLSLDVTEDQAADLRRQLAVSVSGELVDSATAARLLGCKPEYVRDHAAELGGEKLGTGPKARWRFNPAILGAVPPQELQSSTPKSSPRSRRRSPSAGGGLEIRGESPYAP